MESGEIEEFMWCDTTHMLADGLTKELPPYLDGALRECIADNVLRVGYRPPPSAKKKVKDANWVERLSERQRDAHGMYSENRVFWTRHKLWNSVTDMSVRERKRLSWWRCYCDSWQYASWPQLHVNQEYSRQGIAHFYTKQNDSKSLKTFVVRNESQAKYLERSEDYEWPVGHH